MRTYLTQKFVVVAALVVLLLALSISVASASGGTYHRVHWGDTLYSIGRYYGVSPYRIAKANDLYNPNHIYAGQVLYIPTDGHHHDGYDDVDYHHGGHYYSCDHRVMYGETLSSIAYRYGVSAWDIARANNIYDLNHIYAGQCLNIPSGRAHHGDGHGYEHGGYDGGTMY
jgi:LysM repeat protein